MSSECLVVPESKEVLQKEKKISNDGGMSRDPGTNTRILS